MTFGIIWKLVWGFLRPILVFGITLPLWAFLVAGAWLWLDRTSAIRQAVNEAVTELVAGAELTAANATIEEERRRRAAAEYAIAAYTKQASEDAAADAAMTERLEQEIADNEKRLSAAGRQCLLDADDLIWLRNTSGAVDRGR